MGSLTHLQQQAENDPLVIAVLSLCFLAAVRIVDARV
jgi:hypothetical protein